MSQQLYRLFSAEDELLYIGISVSALARFAQHKADKPWIGEVARVAIETHDCARAEIEALERSAIIQEKPKYNIVHAGSGSASYRYTSEAEMGHLRRNSVQMMAKAAAELVGDSVFDHSEYARRRCPDQYTDLQLALAAFVDALDLDVGMECTRDSVKRVVGEMLFAQTIADQPHECCPSEDLLCYPFRANENGKALYVCRNCGQLFSCWW